MTESKPEMKAKILHSVGLQGITAHYHSEEST